MKPIDKFGNPIYPRVFRRLVFYGKILEDAGYRESRRKPNLFYRKTRDCIFFADMRGTDMVPIWEDPSPLFYWKFIGEGEKYPDWRKRRIIKEEMGRLERLGIPLRLSFLEAYEPSGLMFGYGIQGDGYCIVCGRDFQDDGLFCSRECELKYERDTLRSMLDDAPTCEACGKKIVGEHMYEEIKRLLPELLDRVVVSETIRHHISYSEDIVVNVCRPCHIKIHRTNKYPRLRPRDKP